MKHILFVLLAVNIAVGQLSTEDERCTYDRKSKAMTCRGKIKSKNENSVGQILTCSEQDFWWLEVSTPKKHIIHQPMILGHITNLIDHFVGINFDHIVSDALIATSTQLKTFICYECQLKHDPENYNLKTAFSSLENLRDLQIGVHLFDNQTLNDILPNQPTQIRTIDIKANQLTIKTGAFDALNKVSSISFNGATIDRIERHSFKALNYSAFLSVGAFYINFRHCKLGENVFQIGAFDGMEKIWTEITFDGMNINNLPQEVFESYLNGTKLNIESNSVAFTGGSTIDCDDCKNYWLVKQDREDQIFDATCKGDNKLTLFDVEIETKLSQKCK